MAGDAEVARDARPGLVGLFRDMAANCARLGAPTYADLSAFVADQIAAEAGRQADRLGRSDGDPDRDTASGLAALLAPYSHARIGDMVPLRFFAAVQRLALARQAPALALFYESLGGTAPRTPEAREQCRAALLDVVEKHSEEIARGLAWFPQTNEVGRTAALLAVLREIEAAYHLPVRLHEIGASAGLALRVDALADAGVVPMERRSVGAVPVIVERVGCDIAPLDTATQEGRLALTSFIWPDHVDRFERLRGALEVAAEVPVDLVAEDALVHVRSLRLREGTALVVWHSAMWMYLPLAQRRAIAEALTELGASATARSPLVHIALEPVSEAPGEQHVFHLEVTSWPDLAEVPRGVTVTRATTPPSGLPVSWAIPCVGAIVHDASGRLLVIQRGREPSRGRWSVPGGRVHEGEGFAAAVEREVWEETGLAVAVGDMVGAVARSAPDGSTYDIRDYRAHVTGSPQPRAGDDADDARWVGMAELRALPTSPGLLEALGDWGVLPTAP